MLGLPDRTGSGGILLTGSGQVPTKPHSVRKPVGPAFQGSLAGCGKRLRSIHYAEAMTASPQHTVYRTVFFRSLLEGEDLKRSPGVSNWTRFRSQHFPNAV